MNQNVLRNLAVIPLLSLAGCGHETAVWQSQSAGIDCGLQVQVIVRSLTETPTSSGSAENHRVVVSSMLPIISNGGAGHVVSSVEGVLMDLEWDEVRVLQSREDQHHPWQYRLAFKGFRFSIRNQILRPDGVRHRLGTATDKQVFETTFERLFAPVSFEGTEPTGTGEFVVRARMVNDVVDPEPPVIEIQGASAHAEE